MIPFDTWYINTSTHAPRYTNLLSYIKETHTHSNINNNNQNKKLEIDWCFDIPIDSKIKSSTFVMASKKHQQNNRLNRFFHPGSCLFNRTNNRCNKNQIRLFSAICNVYHICVCVCVCILISFRLVIFFYLVFCCD